jgi:hypothetical protein
MTTTHIWIDKQQAIITTTSPRGKPVVERLGRGPMETESAFDARAVVAVLDRNPVAVSGPVFARVAFERAFTSVTHRPERLIDIEPELDARETARAI